MVNMNDRMKTELIGWISTCNTNGDLHTVPVWFLYENNYVRIFTAPTSRKIKNLLENYAASFHLNGGELGNVLSFSGRVELINYDPGSHFLPQPYLDKYAELMCNQNWPQEYLEANFTTEVKIFADKVLSW
jgi:PPOX class probable F420-dependent enzyme